jgi:plasmid stabilization system protein ParE
MTHHVVVTAAAKQNLRDAYRWTAERAPATAVNWLNRFEIELQSLSKFPERCALAPENALVPQEIRQLIYGRRQGTFRALFTIVDNEVRILHIRRATQNWATADDLKLD